MTKKRIPYVRKPKTPPYVVALIFIPLLFCFSIVMADFVGYKTFLYGPAPILPTEVDFDIDGDLQAYVTTFFTENEAPEMIPILLCESEFKHFNPDGTVLMNRQGSSAMGIAQIMSSLHPDPDIIKRYNRRYNTELTTENFNVSSLAGNIGYALVLYKIRGTRDWECAKR